MIPMMLTISRFFLVPFIMRAIAAQHWGMASGLFVVAAITDFLDGFLARLWRQESKIGSYLDPLADKVLMIGCYYSLWTAHLLPSWFFIGLVGKELLLLVAAVLYGSLHNVSMIPLWSGKSAMLVQALFVIGIFIIKSVCAVVIIPLWIMVVIFIWAVVPLLHYACNVVGKCI